MQAPLFSDVVRRRVLDAFDRERTLEEAARSVRNAIVRRTNLGIGADGRAFAPYKPSTARKKGRTRPVTLRERPHSMNLRVVPGVSRSRVPSFWVVPPDAEAERILMYHVRGTPRMARRDPFGLTASERAAVVRQVSVRIRRVLPSRTGKKTMKIRVF